MSTKIYEAWRVPLAQLGEFAAAFDAHTMAKAGERLMVLAAAVKPEVVEKWVEKYPKSAEERGPELECTARIVTVLNVAHKASMAMQRDPWFCLDAALYFHILDGHALIRPAAEYFLTEGFGDEYPSWAYWNNTDPDENVSVKEWAERERTWNEVLEINAYPAFEHHALNIGDRYNGFYPIMRLAGVAGHPEPSKVPVYVGDAKGSLVPEFGDDDLDYEKVRKV